MGFNKTTIGVVLLSVIALAVGVAAQPVGIPASGCQSSGIVTTEQFFNPGSGGFTQDRTVGPGETNVAIGAWTFVDDIVADPSGSGPPTNCPVGGNDFLPTFVTKIAIRPVSGDPVAMGITEITFWLDNNVDGFLNPGQDTQLSTMPASCLTSQAGCVLSFGNAPIFGGQAGLADRPAVNPLGVCPFGCQSILVSANIGNNPVGGSTLQVRVEGQASDITNNPFSPFSSEFSPNFRQVGSNIRAVAEGTGTPPPPTGCPPGFTGTPPFCTPIVVQPSVVKGDVNLNGFVDRNDSRLLGQAIRGRASLTAEQQAAGQVAFPCTGMPDRSDLRLLGQLIRGRATSQCTGASASAQSFSAGQGDLYAPEFLSSAVNNGSGNSETGVVKVELSGIRTRDDRGDLSSTPGRDARPGDREYIVGMVNYCDGGLPVVQSASILPAIAAATPTIAGGPAALPCVLSPLVSTDGFVTNLLRVRVGVSGSGAQFVQAIRVYADFDLDRMLFESGELIFTQIPVNGVASFGSLQQTLMTSGGGALRLPNHFLPGELLYITLDIDSMATASQVDAEVVVDVGDIPGFRSSRLINSAPIMFTFQISGPPGGGTPPPGGGCPPGFTGTPPFCTPIVVQPSVVKGDVNLNGFLDRNDSRLLGQAVRGRASLTAEQQAAGQVASPCTGMPDRSDLRLLSQMIRGRASSQCTASSGFEQTFMQPLSLSSVSVTSGAQGLQFALSGSGIQQAQVQVFDLSGDVVYDSGMSSPYALSWNLLDASGNRVANGVYLYVVRAVGANGQLVSKVSKLVVLK